MSMLAEPRRKRKFGTDPRGLQWSNDENKFGQKLLERMGWKKGKGLGAKEDGKPDHVAVNLKNDKMGVGCSKTHADSWVAHQDDFNALLASLNSNNETSQEEDGNTKSLEEMSKSMKGRIHYKKFAKGKDLTNANTEDMDCIFGRRKIQSAPCTPQNQSEVETSSDEDDSKQTTDHGITTFTSGTSVQDYFKQKLSALKAKQGLCTSEPTSRNQSDEESARDLQSHEAVFDSSELVKKKKKSKRKRGLDQVTTDNLTANDDTPVDDEMKPKKKGKSKRKEKERESGAKQGKASENIENVPLTKVDNVVDDIQDKATANNKSTPEETREKKRKSKKSKTKSEVDSSEQDTPEMEPPVKKRKRNKNAKGVEDSAIEHEENTRDISDHGSEELVSVTKKKKKHKNKNA